MNDFSIVVKKWPGGYVNEEVNKFIAECNKNGDLIEDINTHVNVIHGTSQAYTFIFKVKRNPHGKRQDDERR
ncbi:hypothetical protein ACIQHV_19020 [Bacillus bombysepticus]|uniref:Uncharacterized protein n=1 Tax=Bacillus thuringiensis serovar kumamotoensis TaxID=132267 RepID=A0A9X6JLP3_BACUK|nr:hypothetical protein [Bacillus thuringiensis]MEC2868904.1 hypothetical protein [Bacillus cereus]OTZ69277.1 hypothetical protein BK769_23140 [Bacillus thuringiensis serovar kumamtoensis]